MAATVAMIDTDNLRTASLYINNQLLSRGLIRDGESIDFAGTGKGEEGSDAITYGRIISIVNDLIIRRDRDAEHRESLSATMRNLRADNIKLTKDVERLAEKQTDGQRRADIATASETALKTQLKTAEANARTLKDEVARMRSLVAQSRSSCANEVRRRDRQIEALKKQVTEAGRSRGTRANPAVTTITVTGEVGRRKASPTAAEASPTKSMAVDDVALQTAANSSLAGLAQHLTEENDALLAVMQRAMDQLRDMSGWPGNDDNKEDAQVKKRADCEEVAADLDSVLDHMSVILNNPSFVSIEEVMAREEEINRLKNGWVKMESRWKDAVHLMESWRKRMAASGRPVCDADLRMGLQLSPVRVHGVAETSGASSVGLTTVIEGMKEAGQLFMDDEDVSDGFPNSDNDSDDDSADDENDAPDAGEEEAEQREELEDKAQPPNTLQNSNSAGNRGVLQVERTRSRPTVAQADTGPVDAETTGSKTMRSQPVRPRISATQSRLPSRVPRPHERPRSPSRTSLDDALLPKPAAVKAEPGQGTVTSDGPSKQQQAPPKQTIRGAPRLSPSKGAHPRLPRNDALKPQQSPLTMTNIAAKLAASEKEADAARVRAKLRAARRSTRGPSQTTNTEAGQDDIAEQPEQMEQRATAEQDQPAPITEPKPEKRKRDRKMSKAASRRRSTLSPWELETLMAGNAAA